MAESLDSRDAIYFNDTCSSHLDYIYLDILHAQST